MHCIESCTQNFLILSNNLQSFKANNISSKSLLKIPQLHSTFSIHFFTQPKNMKNFCLAKTGHFKNKVG